MKNLKEADVVILGANIIPMDQDIPFAEAIAAKDGRIVCVGINSDVLHLIGKKTIVIDAQKRSILPGFIDCHVHFMGSAIAAYYIDVSNVHSLADMLELLRSKAAEMGKDEWIRARGFDDSRVTERRYPTRKELDRIAPDNPIIFKRQDGHSCVINSMALEILDLSEDLSGFELDPDTGEFSGILRKKANSIAGKKVNDLIPDELRVKGLAKTAEIAAQRGVTTIHAMDGTSGDSKHISMIKEHVNELPLRVIQYYQTTDVRDVETFSFSRIGGCILIDGTMDSHTAALREPYADKPSTSGGLYFDDDVLEGFIEEAHRKGLQIATHAIGDRAVDQLLDVYEKVLNAYPRQDHRHRIEHIEIPCEDQLERCKELGIALSVQPSFVYCWDVDMYESRIGTSRVKRLHHYKNMIDRGLLVGGGSDSPVTPINPIVGIHTAVNHPIPGNGIDVMSALRMFTSAGARLAFEEDVKGSLTTGKYADMVILSDDPLTVEKERLKDIEIEATLIGGKISYSSGSILEKK